MAETRTEFSNGEITVVWQPKKCIHSGVCIKGLPAVFQHKEKPWVKMDGASTAMIIQQVVKCPSGALSFVSDINSESNLKPGE